jgi:hypothetical protein
MINRTFATACLAFTILPECALSASVDVISAAA